MIKNNISTVAAPDQNWEINAFFTLARARGGRTDKSGTNRGCVTINLKAKTWVTPQQCCHGITTPGEGWVGPHRPCSVASQGCGGAQIAQPAPWSCPQLGPWAHPAPAVAPTQARTLVQLVAPTSCGQPGCAHTPAKPHPCGFRRLPGGGCASKANG